jgi:hypothetical protein
MDAYLEAQRVYADAVMSTATGQDRVAELQRTLQRIGDLVDAAAPDERATVLLMNSSIAELIITLPEEAR